MSTPFSTPTLAPDPPAFEALQIQAQPTASSTLTLEQVQQRQKVVDQLNAAAPSLSPTDSAALQEYTSLVNYDTWHSIARTSLSAGVIGVGAYTAHRPKFSDNILVQGLRSEGATLERTRSAIADGEKLTRAERLYTSGLGSGLDPEKNMAQRLDSATLRAKGGVKNTAQAYKSDLTHLWNSELEKQQLNRAGKQLAEEAGESAAKQGSKKVAAELAEGATKRAAAATATKVVAGAAGRTVAKAGVGIAARLAGKAALGAIPVVGPVIAVATLFTDPLVSQWVRKGLEFTNDTRTPDPLTPPEPPRTEFLPLCYDGNRDEAIVNHDGLLQQANVETFDYLPANNWNINDLEVKTTPALTNVFEQFNVLGNQVEQLVTDTVGLYANFQGESYVQKLGEARAAFLDSMGTLLPEFLSPSLDAAVEPVLAYADAWVAFQQAIYNARVVISESNKPDNDWFDFSFGVTPNKLTPEDFPDSPHAMLQASVGRMEQGMRAFDEAGKTWNPPAIPATAQVTGVSNSDAQKLASGQITLDAKGNFSSLGNKSEDILDAEGFPGLSGGGFTAPSIPTPSFQPGGSFSMGAPTAPSVPGASGFSAPKAPTLNTSGSTSAPKAPSLGGSDGLTPPKAPSINGSDGLSAPKAPTINAPGGLNAPTPPKAPTINTPGGLNAPTPPKAPTVTMPKAPETTHTSGSAPTVPTAPSASGTSFPTVKTPTVDKVESPTPPVAPVVPQPPKMSGNASSNAATTTSGSDSRGTSTAPKPPNTDPKGGTPQAPTPPTIPTTATSIPGKLDPANPSSPLNTAPLTQGLRGEPVKPAAPAGNLRVTPPAAPAAPQGPRINFAPPAAPNVGETVKATISNIGGGGENTAEKTDPAPVDPHDPAANPEGAGGEARESTSITREGQTYEMGTSKAAKLAELFAPGDGSPGMSLREAAAAAGFKVPPMGFDIGTPVSPAELQPGDVVIGDGIEGVYIGNGLCLTDRGVLPLSEVAIFTGENHGFFRLDGNLRAEDSLATGQKSSAEADILKSASTATGTGPGGVGGAGGGVPGRGNSAQSADPYDPKTASTTGRKMSVTGSGGVGSMPNLNGTLPTVPKVPSVD